MDHEFKRNIEALEAEQRTKVGEVCDFCGQPPGRWVYTARPVTAQWDGDDTPFQFSPEWCACDACHAFIQAGDREGLLTHHQKVFRNSMMMQGVPEDGLQWLERNDGNTRQIHQLFFDNWVRTIPVRENEPENLRPN